MDRRIYIAAIITGVVSGILISFSPGSFFILFLTSITIFFINRLSSRNERNFLLTLFLAGFGTRIILALLTQCWAIFSGHMLNYAGYGCPNYNTPYILDDGGYYTLRGLFTSMHWLGKPMSQYTIESIVKNAYGFSGFIYILASYFTLFGYSPISSRFINCFLGALTAILIYTIVKNTFGEKPARLSAIFTAFLPSLFLWSITNLKETAFIFTVYVMLWAVIKFRRTRKIYYLFITALFIWTQFLIRSAYKEFAYFTITTVSFYLFYLFALNWNSRKKIVFFLILFILGGSFTFFARGRINSVFNNVTRKALISHRGAISEGGICYKLLPDEFYTTPKNISQSDFFKMLGKGWLHIMFEPFPWKIQTKPMLFIFPQMLLWYFLIPFAILGMGISVRYRLKETLVLSLYFLVMTSGLAVTGGNIGTIFRFRDVVTPILLIFSSVGLIKVFSCLNFKTGNGDNP